MGKELLRIGRSMALTSVLAMPLCAMGQGDTAPSPDEATDAQTEQPAEPQPMPDLINYDPLGQYLPLTEEVDLTARPTVTVRWTKRDGEKLEVERELRYRYWKENLQLGWNLRGFARVWGMRYNAEACKGDGVVLTFGVEKMNMSRLMFKDMAKDTVIEIEARGIRFNSPRRLDPTTAVHFCQYSQEDAWGCGVRDAALMQYNTALESDDLNGTVNEDNGRLGVLGGDGPDEGTVTVRVEEDGSHTVIARLPYSLFRNVKDPWIRTEPGAFLEPFYAHIEIEALPIEQVEPDTAATNEEPEAHSD